MRELIVGPPEARVKIIWEITIIRNFYMSAFWLGTIDDPWSAVAL